MNPIIDLVIALNPPAAAAPPDTLAEFDLSCPAFGGQHARGLLTNPFDDSLRSDLQWYLEESWMWPFAEFAQRAAQIEGRLERLGQALFDHVLRSTPQAQMITQSWNLQPLRPGQSRQISLELQLTEEQVRGDAPVDPRLFTALTLPWELLHDGNTFLALRPRQPVALVRRMPEQNINTLLEQFTPPLRVLLVTARPEGAGFIDPRGIARPLYDAVEEQMAAGELVIEYLRPPTLPALVARLNDPQPPPSISCTSTGMVPSSPRTTPPTSPPTGCGWRPAGAGRWPLRMSRAIWRW